MKISNCYARVLNSPRWFAGCESSETDGDEIISIKSLLMTTANISYKSHRRRCVIAATEIYTVCKVR